MLGQRIGHERIRTSLRLSGVLGTLVLLVALGSYWVAARGGRGEPLAQFLAPPALPAGWSIDGGVVEPIEENAGSLSGYREGARVTWQISGASHPEVEWIHLSVELYRFSDPSSAARAAEQLAHESRASLTGSGLREGTVIEVDGWPLVVRHVAAGEGTKQLRGWTLVSYALDREVQEAVALPGDALRAQEVQLVLVSDTTVASVAVHANERALALFDDVLGQLLRRLAIDPAALSAVPLPTG
ncbi:MAG: hypothetical protein N2Z82_09500 [Thermomicrobium sp.]|nr:hypothetical protein [Thermomicrobium sp.]